MQVETSTVSHFCRCQYQRPASCWAVWYDYLIFSLFTFVHIHFPTSSMHVCLFQTVKYSMWAHCLAWIWWSPTPFRWRSLLCPHLSVPMSALLKNLAWSLNDQTCESPLFLPLMTTSWHETHFSRCFCDKSLCYWLWLFSVSQKTLSWLHV